jgi:ATP-dependent DNA helicase RecG
MLEAGLQPPAFSRREGAVVVTFGLPGKAMTAVSVETATGKTTGKTQEKVWHFLAENPHLSVPELATHLKKSELTIHRAIRTLRESGRLERVGPDKGGHWKVKG